MLAELNLDESRLRFTGLLSRARLLTLMQGSDAHVYLTLPFVLSWSMIEAMSVGCRLVVSDVAPVREALGARDAALLVDHHDPANIVAAVEETLDRPEPAAQRAAAARARAIEAYDMRWIWPARASHLAELL